MPSWERGRKKQFEALVKVLDVCAMLNDCDQCTAVERCRAKFDAFCGTVPPFNYSIEPSDHRESALNYDTAFVSTLIKNYLRRDFNG